MMSLSKLPFIGIFVFLVILALFSCELFYPPVFYEDIVNGTIKNATNNGGGSELTNYFSPNIGTLKYVSAGKFQYDGNQADVCTISSAFRMSQYDITGAQFAAVTGLPDPSSFLETGHPVEQVTWYQAIVFCNDLSILEGLTPVYTINGNTTPSSWGAIPTADNSTWDAVIANWSANGYRLPTEMEYMWAAMGAANDALSGDIVGGINTGGYVKGYAGSTEPGGGQNNVNNYAWASVNAGSTTHQVGTRTANELGLYDMSGNVWQWCFDWFDSYPGTPISDPTYASSLAVPVVSPIRVIRGGDWNSTPITIAGRNDYYPWGGGNNTGFRVVRP